MHVVLCTLSWELGSIVKLCVCRFYGGEGLCNCCCIPPSRETQKHQALVQLRRGDSTRQVAAAVGRSQSWVAKVRKEIARELEKQRGGRPRHLSARERRRCITLITKGRLQTATQTASTLRNETG
jgi:transposase